MTLFGTSPMKIVQVFLHIATYFNNSTNPIRVLVNPPKSCGEFTAADDAKLKVPMLSDPPAICQTFRQA